MKSAGARLITTQRIHALPLQLANQIAAGEVVERPASVLKELIENSIDAGATRLDITIEGAGRELIKVSDNGSGIHPDDLLLALSRHATSKLHSSEQLSQIASLGFRGEALPSIASVSRLNLISKQPDMECGWQLQANSEKIEPHSHPDGTTVSVAELFFNLPARRHFLRSDKTELHHLQTTFNRLALSRFDIGFNARFSNQQSIRLPALTDKQQYHARIGKICGQAFVRDSVYLQQHYDDITLQGWLGKAHAHRAQTDVQYFFINGRIIKDRVINHAIRLAYGEQLPNGRQAAYVLYLTLPLNKVDVNVHPAKHEVRFRDARLIHGLITRGVEEALAHQQTTATEQSPLMLAEPASADQVAESALPYATQTVKPQQTSATNTRTQTLSTKTAEFSLLYERYALLMEPVPALVDLQRLDFDNRQQQLQTAIQQSQIASRSILVPVKLGIDKHASALFQQHENMLAECGFTFSLHQQSVLFQRIPFLLSSVDLHAILQAVIKALADTDNKQAFAKQLTQVLPLTPIRSASAAEQILAQLSREALTGSEYYRILDPAALAGLFST